jgi:methylated-DNA-protein-cysteine methyltransferase-like protein
MSARRAQPRLTPRAPEEWSQSGHERIYRVVRLIPEGRVATYGQIAEIAGLPRQPRLVGYALHALTSSTSVPWHRVVNARGMVSIRSDGAASLSQRLLLEREGVEFDARGRLSLERFGWRPRARRRRVAQR